MFSGVEKTSGKMLTNSIKSTIMKTLIFVYIGKKRERVLLFIDVFQQAVALCVFRRGTMLCQIPVVDK